VPLWFKFQNNEAAKAQRITKKNNNSLYFFQPLIHTCNWISFFKGSCFKSGSLSAYKDSSLAWSIAWAAAHIS
jgi:hypothetical protein